MPESFRLVIDFYPPFESLTSIWQSPSISQPLVISNENLIYPPPPFPSTSTLSPVIGSSGSNIAGKEKAPLKNRSREDPSHALAQASSVPALDFRYGPLSVDWVDWVDTSVSPTSQTMPRPAERAGSSKLSPGILHLYKELGADDDTKEERVNGEEEDDECVVGFVAVPGNLEVSHFLRFITPALPSIVQLRMLKDSTPNRTIILVKFKQAKDAREFTVVYNGKPYYDTKDSEICQVVKISSIKLTSSSRPPFAYSASPSLPSSSSVELPCCSICLERLDGNVSGLVTISCRHTFHCSCLVRWGDARCPICRSSQGRNRKPALDTIPPRCCTECSSPSNLWQCLICANVGCGRYQGGHAANHHKATQHAYAMETATQRIWSYVDERYVHRLIRDHHRNGETSESIDRDSNEGEGRIVELPSSSSSTTSTMKGGPDHSAVESQDKLEAISIEYAFIMSAQLDSQRSYYEDEISIKADQLSIVERKWDEARAGWETEKQARSGTEKRLKEVEAERERIRKEGELKVERERKLALDEANERKKERNEATRAKKEMYGMLEQERAMTASLVNNLAALKEQVKLREEETKAIKSDMEELQDQMRDVMFALSARDQIEAQGGASEIAGGDISVPAVVSTSQKTKKKKK